jgi:hypothetical protein
MGSLLEDAGGPPLGALQGTGGPLSKVGGGRTLGRSDEGANPTPEASGATLAEVAGAR